MSEKENIKLHKKTIKKHRKIVRKLCFRLGLYWQGLTHDLSKYSKVEMQVAKWYDGKESPHDIARSKLGYSPSWHHHFHKNAHHWEYYISFNKIDYINEKPIIIPEVLKMPFKYVLEMICDFIGAGMAYNSDKPWTSDMPYDYWMCFKDKRLLQPDTEYLFTGLLFILKEIGLDDFIKWLKANKKYLEKHYNYGDRSYLR